jgi:hypothetical protein
MFLLSKRPKLGIVPVLSYLMTSDFGFVEFSDIDLLYFILLGLGSSLSIKKSSL